MGSLLPPSGTGSRRLDEFSAKDFRQRKLISPE